MQQTYGSVVFYLGSVLFLLQKEHIRLVHKEKLCESSDLKELRARRISALIAGQAI
jgi:hypothetical protein